MSKRTVVVFVGVAFLAAVGLITAQEGARGPGGRRGPQGGRPQFGPMDGPTGKRLDNLAEAHERKDMEKIGQLIDQMKQQRQQFAGRMGGGGTGGRPQGMRGPGGFGPSGPQADSRSLLDSPRIPKTDAAKKVLTVLDKIDKDRGQ